jgi:protein disulfide-isomerase
VKRVIQRLVLIAVLIAGGAMQAVAGAWLTDVEEAKRAAAKKGVPIVANFSGSDWCGWCIKLDEEVFSKEEFLAYAKDNVILLTLDFPRRKVQSKAVSDQNKALASMHGVRGFPTVLVLDATGKELARTGYRKGGPAAYVKHLKQLIAK